MSMRELKVWADRLHIKGFRGVFMRDLLPDQPQPVECGIINLGGSESLGTHWTCYFRNGAEKLYFDSYGDSKPPRELVCYIGANNLKYNSYGFQKYNDPPICGHLCLEVLRRLSAGASWESVESALQENKFVWQTWYDHA